MSVDDAGATAKLTLPRGVHLTDIFSTGADLIAVGVSGATLRLAITGRCLGSPPMLLRVPACAVGTTPR